jgi:hypothetical protein
VKNFAEKAKSFSSLVPECPGCVFSFPKQSSKLLQFSRAMFKAQAQNLFSAVAGF